MSIPSLVWKKAAIALLVALLAFPLGMRLVGSVDSETSLGDISFQVKPAFPGGGSLYVPVADWGLRFNLFAPPVLIQSEPKRIDREGLLQAASGDETVLLAAQRDINNGVAKVLLIVALTGIALTTLLALLTSRIWPVLGRRFPFWGFAASSLLALSFFLIGLLTYSPSALDRPSFYARGEELGQLLDVIRRESSSEKGSYQDNFSRVLKGVSSFLSDKKTVAADGDRGAVVFSDLHSNALALPAMQRFADNKPVFFVGDFAHEGNDAEAALLASRVSELGSEVIAVSGNHDSASLMRSLASEGVRVIGQEGILQSDGSWRKGLLSVMGMKVAGWQDPLEWQGDWPGDPGREFSFAESDISMSRAEEELWKWWEATEKKPDILLIHQNSLAESLGHRLAESGYPRPLTIITGHDHRQWISSTRSLNIVDAGSAGAGGLFGLGSENGQMAEIYFSSQTGKLETVDMVQIDPLRGGALAQRIVTDDICWLPCRYQVRQK